MRSPVRHLYEFGPFRLDAEKLRLTRDGELVPLFRKDVESLLVLVRNPGKALEREELMLAVWEEYGRRRCKSYGSHLPSA